MVALQGTVPQIFPFSARDDAAAHQIERAAGQCVALTYEQHRGMPPVRRNRVRCYSCSADWAVAYSPTHHTRRRSGSFVLRAHSPNFPGTNH
jgi:hypothetical protein